MRREKEVPVGIKWRRGILNMYIVSSQDVGTAGIPIEMRRSWHIALTDVGAGCGEGTYTNLPWPEFETREGVSIE